ncbi:hypothetical protein D3C76_1754630 [compost metagenome]
MAQSLAHGGIFEQMRRVLDHLEGRGEEAAQLRQSGRLGVQEVATLERRLQILAFGDLREG